MSNAPVCNVKGVQNEGSPSLGVLQPVPLAHDLQSLIKAVQALTNNFNTLAGGITNGFNTKNGDSKQSDWEEDRGKRVVKTVRVTNPQDSEQFVDVEQINSYTMKNKKTGENWKWTR